MSILKMWWLIVTYLTVALIEAKHCDFADIFCKINMESDISEKQLTWRMKGRHGERSSQVEHADSFNLSKRDWAGDREMFLLNRVRWEIDLEFLTHCLLNYCSVRQGARLSIPDLGLNLDYSSGTVVGICGTVLQHEVGSWGNGDRVCYAHFMREEVRKRLDVPPAGWVNRSQYGPGWTELLLQIPNFIKSELEYDNFIKYELENDKASV